VGAKVLSKTDNIGAIVTALGQQDWPRDVQIALGFRGGLGLVGSRPMALCQRNGASPIPSNRDIDEVAFLANRQMKAEQRKLPGESKYPVVS
jgi:hypothetical protein